MFISIAHLILFTMNKNLIFKQLFEKESSTYTYLLADKNSKEAVLIDPVKEMVKRDLKLINELNLKLKYILDTHVHADHVTGSFDLKKETNAKIIEGIDSQVKCADKLLNENDEILFGEFKLRALLTPGHTDGCTTYVLDSENIAFTGDTILIRIVGRCDFQQGNSNKLFESIQKIFKLGNDFKIYPGHDYRGFSSSTVLEEKKI